MPTETELLDLPESPPAPASAAPGGPPAPAPVERVEVFGLALARLTYEETLDRVDALIERGEPAYFITANLHYAMLCARDPRLAAVNRRAAFLVADGMPLVWYSRLLGRPIPERVTGADLVVRISERAAQKGRRLFLLGGAPGVAETAAAALCRRYPTLAIAGVEAPHLDALSPQEHAALVRRVREARPHVLFVALGQPKGELWLAEHCAALGVPACVQIGASLDFAAGRVRRAPRWVQRTGLEWLWRAAREPRRLAPRYAADAAFLLKSLLRDAAAAPWSRSSARRKGPSSH